MKFLVILICLTVNYLWSKDINHFDDGWFFKLRARVENVTANPAAGLPFGWLFSIALIYGIPLLTLGVLLLILDDRGYGIPTILVHIIVLLIAFDRTQPGKLAKDFLAKWRNGDVEGCALYVQQELHAPAATEITDAETLTRFFSKQLIYRWFEKMFVMFFWYMPGGPMAVLFCYISYQLRDSHREDQADAEVRGVTTVIGLLEWIPLRLLALTFSLAGNFVECFERIKKTFWEFGRETDSAELLYGYAGCALSGRTAGAEEADAEEAGAREAGTEEAGTEEAGTEEAGAEEAGVEDAGAEQAGAEQSGQASASGDRAHRRKAAEIEALQALLERSQAIWLIALALMTVFGLQLP